MPITLALRIGISRLTMSVGHEHNKIGMMIYIIDHSSLYISYHLCPAGPKMPHSVTQVTATSGSGIQDGRTKETATYRRPSKCLSDTT